MVLQLSLIHIYLDQASPIAAKLQTNLLLPLIYPFIRDGRFKSRLLQKRLTQRKSEMGGYVQAFMEMLGGARPYVTMQSLSLIHIWKISTNKRSGSPAFAGFPLLQEFV